MPFVEALRQFQFRVGQGNFCLIHVSLVPVLGVVGEQKTKPTQHSVQVLRSLGLMPHLLACRTQVGRLRPTHDRTFSPSLPPSSHTTSPRFLAPDPLPPAPRSLPSSRA